MNDFFSSLFDTADAFWKFICGLACSVLGYFLPIKNLVHLVVLFFILDMVFGYWAARKLRGEKFSTKIVWRTTFPRMLISIVLIIMAFLWDTTCKQNWLPTYNLIGWFISGVLIYSISRNGFKITNWYGFLNLENVFRKKFSDESGADITQTK